MMKLRIIGFLLFIVGGVMLILLYTPHKEWALNHSVRRGREQEAERLYPDQPKPE